MAEHTPAETGTVPARPLAPVVRTVASAAVASLVVACVGFGLVGDAWYDAGAALVRSGIIVVIGLLFEALGLGWTRAADESQSLVSATIESPVRTAWRVLAMLAVVAAVGAALAVAFEEVEAIFEALATAAGILGWGTVVNWRWERRTGRTLLQVRSGWFRKRGWQLGNVPAVAVRRTPSTGTA